MPPALSRKLKRRSKTMAQAALALLVFLVGIALIAFAFKLAYDLFTVPPQVAVAGSDDQPMELNATVNNLGRILTKTLLLVVMAFIGSLVANQGIKLYSRPAARPSNKPATPPKSPSKETENET